MDALVLMQWGFAPALATALLHSLWQVTLLGLGAATALAVLSRASAAIRHATAMAFLLAMVGVPAATFVRFWQQPAASINDGWLPAITAPRTAASLPLPPLPPEPPEPPDIVDDAVFQSLLRMVVADPVVVARLGSPVVMASNDVSGSIDVDDTSGDADVAFALRGPKGRADVHVDAQLDDGKWSMDPVDFESAVR